MDDSTLDEDEAELTQFPWYAGNISRETVEPTMLQDGHALGDFCVRSSSQAGSFALSMVSLSDTDDGSFIVKHNLISRPVHITHYNMRGLGVSKWQQTSLI